MKVFSTFNHDWKFNHLTFVIFFCDKIENPIYIYIIRCKLRGKEEWGDWDDRKLKYIMGDEIKWGKNK